MLLGGFIPRRFAQCSCDPFWMFFAFAIGFEVSDYLSLALKLNAPDIIYDPHRYVYNAHMDHHEEENELEPKQEK